MVPTSDQNASQDSPWSTLLAGWVSKRPLKQNQNMLETFQPSVGLKIAGLALRRAGGSRCGEQGPLLKLLPHDTVTDGSG